LHSRRGGQGKAHTLDPEAAQDEDNFDSRKKVDVVGLDKAESGNLKESKTEKAEAYGILL